MDGSHCSRWVGINVAEFFVVVLGEGAVGGAVGGAEEGEKGKGARERRGERGRAGEERGKRCVCESCIVAGSWYILVAGNGAHLVGFSTCSLAFSKLISILWYYFVCPFCMFSSFSKLI